MRATAIAVIFSLLLSSCAPSGGRGDSDIMGAAVIAVILGVGVAALAHSD